MWSRASSSCNSSSSRRSATVLSSMAVLTQTSGKFSRAAISFTQYATSFTILGGASTC